MLDEGDKMLDDGFEEEVVLIGGEALRTKTQTQYWVLLKSFFFPGHPAISVEVLQNS